MGKGLNSSGQLVDVPQLDPATVAQRSTATQKRKDFRAVQQAAAQELINLKALAIDYFIRGESYPAELAAHRQAVQLVLDASPSDALPVLPARPVLDIASEK